MHCSSEQHGTSIPISRGLVLGCRIAYFAERRLPPELQFTAFFLGYQGIQSLWDCPEGIWKVPNQLDFQGHSTDTVDVHSTPLLWYQRLTDHLPTFWDIITPITHLNFQMELQKTQCSLRRKEECLRFHVSLQESSPQEVPLSRAVSNSNHLPRIVPRENHWIVTGITTFPFNPIWSIWWLFQPISLSPFRPIFRMEITSLAYHTTLSEKITDTHHQHWNSRPIEFVLLFLPFGKRTVCYWKLPLIGDLPI